MNKVLVSVSIPVIEEEYEFFLSINKSVGNAVKTIIQIIADITRSSSFKSNLNLYDKTTGDVYDKKMIIKDTNIRNGSELILL